MTKEEKFNVIVNHAFGGWHHVQKMLGNAVCPPVATAILNAIKAAA